MWKRGDACFISNHCDGPVIGLVEEDFKNDTYDIKLADGDVWIGHKSEMWETMDEARKVWEDHYNSFEYSRQMDADMAMEDELFQQGWDSYAEG